MCSVKFQVIKNNLNGACWLYKENWNTNAFILQSEDLTDCCKLLILLTHLMKSKKLKMPINYVMLFLYILLEI